jgi:hypothetical protein
MSPSGNGSPWGGDARLPPIFWIFSVALVMARTMSSSLRYTRAFSIICNEVSRQSKLPMRAGHTEDLQGRKETRVQCPLRATEYPESKLPMRAGHRESRAIKPFQNGSGGYDGRIRNAHLIFAMPLVMARMLSSSLTNEGVLHHLQWNFSFWMGFQNGGNRSHLPLGSFQWLWLW